MNDDLHLTARCPEVHEIGCWFFWAGNRFSMRITTGDRNLFVICVAYYTTYLPVMLRMVLRAKGVIIPDAVEFAVSWIYISSAAVNGFLYMALHSSVRRELRRYLPRCRRNTVAPAAIQPAGDGGRQRHSGIVNIDAASPGAPAMTSSCQQETERITTTNLWRCHRGHITVVWQLLI